MRKVRWLGLLALIALLLVPAGAAAHASAPLQEQTVQAGPYAIKISYYSLPRTSQEASLTLTPLTSGPAFGQVRAELRPAPGTDSTPRTLVVRPDPLDGPGVLEVLMTANVVGAWTLHLAVDGPAGAQTVDVPVAVGGPPTIPVWLGWLIALLPLGLAILFVALQVRGLRRRGALAPMPG